MPRLQAVVRPLTGKKLAKKLPILQVVCKTITLLPHDLWYFLCQKVVAEDKCHVD